LEINQDMGGSYVYVDSYGVSPMGHWVYPMFRQTQSDHEEMNKANDGMMGTYLYIPTYIARVAKKYEICCFTMFADCFRTALMDFPVQIWM